MTHSFLNPEPQFNEETLRLKANPSKGQKAPFLDRVLAELINNAYIFSALMIIQGWVTDPTAQILIMGITLGGFMAFFPHGLTPGKYVMRLRVIRLNENLQAGFWQMVLRELVGKTISQLAFYLGFLWIPFNQNGCGWHDLLAQTVVIKETPK